jgi:hypothetical protein
MILEFIAFIAAGFATAGVVMLVNRLTGNRLPRWLIPAAIGGGMFAFALWSEYSWYPRTTGTLPEGVVVATDNAHASSYRPWTYIVPIVTRFIAVDTRTTRAIPEAEGHVATSIILLGRWERGAQLGVVFDCTGGRRADLVGAVTLDDAGLPADPDAWIPVGLEDPVLQTACQGG